MPKFSVVLTHTAVVSVEAPSAEALDAALDDGETFAALIEYIDDSTGTDWDITAEIKAAVPDAVDELLLKDGKLHAVGEEPMRPT